MALDQQTVIARYQRGVQNGATSYREGVTGKGNVWKSAATSDNAEARYAAGVQKAAANKTRQRKLSAVASTDWEQQAINVGANAYSAAATKAATKYSAIAQHVVGAANAAQQAAATITGASIADRLNRAREAQIAAHRYWSQVNGTTPEI